MLLLALFYQQHRSGRLPTLEAVEKVESMFGRTSLGQPEKLSRFQAIVAEHLKYDELMQLLKL